MYQEIVTKKNRYDGDHRVQSKKIETFAGNIHSTQKRDIKKQLNIN